MFVVCQTEAEVERLAEILRTTQLAAAGRLHFPLGSLRQGFRLVRRADRADQQRRAVPPRRPAAARRARRLGKAIDSFLELREGDLVVHVATASPATAA